MAQVERCESRGIEKRELPENVRQILERFGISSFRGMTEQQAESLDPKDNRAILEMLIDR